MIDLASMRTTVGSAAALGCVLLLSLQGVMCRAEVTRVTVDAGIVAGSSDGTVSTFKGIPYAKAPVGPLRWRPPQPPARWSGAREATAFGAACPQAMPVDTVAGPAATSEDCLTLNVWAPAHASRPAPVMVWLHGGGNDSGSGSKRYYDGAAFARDGVVLVSLNYRLGSLGFFAHPALTREAAPDAPLGNYGLMDQIAALRWVKGNIAAFGGDPEAVTLFGESAGGTDTLLLMTCASAAGLFQRAIVESAGIWSSLPSLAEREADGVKLAAALVGQATAATVGADRLRAITVEDLVKAEAGGRGPMVDGRLVTERVEQALAAGRGARVPLVIGTNSDEGSLVSDLPAAEILSGFGKEVLAKARALYGTGADDAALARALFRDKTFTAPARWIAAQASSRAPVYLYRFSYLRPRQRGHVPGAAHGSEIPYVFDSWSQAPMGGALLGAEVRAEAALLHGCWIAFASSGVPTCPGAPAWPRYTPEEDKLMELGAEASVRSSPDRAVLEVIGGP
jgi:para-nitrobenzyl esterase